MSRPSTTTTTTEINSNNMSEIPQWLNKEFFKPAFKQVLNFKEISSIIPITTETPDKTVGSDFIRVLLEVKLTDNTIVKTTYLLKSDKLLNTKESTELQPSNTFLKEKHMYLHIIPVLTKMYASINGLNIKLAPLCMHAAISTEDAVLVLEDFSRKKFHNVDRFKGFDMLHMRWALRKLAEFHAATTVYFATQGPYPDLYQESFCNASNIRMVKRITEKRQLHFRNAMRQWGLPHVEDFIKKMPTIKDYMEAALKSNNVDPNEFNVLNHGQLFNTNILFNYNESGVIDEAIFIGFQYCNYGSPAQDLWQLIITSAELDIKIREFDHFLFIYHAHLIECLKLLKYETEKPWPTLMDIQQMMLKYGFWGPIAANTTLCNLLLPTSEQSSLENMFRPGHEGDILRYKSFTNPHYAKAMCQLIPFFAYKGI
ncbi:uncharacterized protein LOC119679506 [Teleopsis dalmanni]|uniref:uncharacterized protein LOC119679506 n=1 Tax=Teleopsis dalmanni TaxID=139649 RepID=UPI000D32A469|nr:uncharacterized protein LOC119679506 [Teleopsis dalmanni]